MRMRPALETYYRDGRDRSKCRPALALADFVGRHWHLPSLLSRHCPLLHACMSPHVTEAVVKKKQPRRSISCKPWPHDGWWKGSALSTVACMSARVEAREWRYCWISLIFTRTHIHTYSREFGEILHKPLKNFSACRCMEKEHMHEWLNWTTLVLVCCLLKKASMRTEAVFFSRTILS